MTNYILKTVKADGSAYGDFVWPLEVGAQVVAPDFNTDASCGGGLHGLLNGCGNGALLNWGDGAVWIVAKVPKKAQMVDLGDKVKVDRCKIVHVGNRETATTFLVDHGCSGPIVGVTATAGDDGTAIAGYGGTATAGNGGIATAGEEGTAIAGYRGTATAGKWGTATAGYRGTATAGYRGTAIAGYGGTAIAGYGGTATAGKWGTAIAGYGGTAIAGDGGTLILRRWNGDRYRTVVGYVGEDGILANVAYRLNENGKMVKV